MTSNHYFVKDMQYDAKPIFSCENCGCAIYDGDALYFDISENNCFGCEHCVKTKYAQEE